MGVQARMRYLELVSLVSGKFHRNASWPPVFELIGLRVTVDKPDSRGGRALCATVDDDDGGDGDVRSMRRGGCPGRAAMMSGASVTLHVIVRFAVFAGTRVGTRLEDGLRLRTRFADY